VTNNCAALAEPVAAIATAQATTAALNMDTIDFSFKQKETHKATAYTVNAKRENLHAPNQPTDGLRRLFTQIETPIQPLIPQHPA
jgi:hypothetical protein